MLRTLLTEARLKRMAEQVAFDPKGSYAPIDMLADLRHGIWSELEGDPVEIDLYRRNLQRAHLQILIDEVGKESASSDLPALSRGELKALVVSINEASTKKLSPMTRVHLDDLKARILQALEPKAVVQPSASPTPGRIIFGGDARDDEEEKPEF